MTPEVQAVVHSTQAWLRSSWQVQVPFAWLEACVEWLQEEAGGAGRLSQQQINQQALDQWLLTDLRDLGHPVLPESFSQAQQTELSGTFCVQVDSLLDIGQPAYGQLQKWKGSDCTNDDVSAVTQATQRPWEARPTRMLLLQVTDGVQSLEAMEYQSIPALSTALRPGVKLQLQGKMVCRLGMLLLGPSNIKVLGGEVEELVERNTPGKVLCRTLGLPEEEQQQQQERADPAHQQGNQEVEDLEFDDAELLASVEAQEVAGRVPVGPVGDSGYGTLGETYTQSQRSSSVRSLVSTASSRSGLIQGNRGGSVQGCLQGDEQEDFDLLNQPEILDHNMADEDFPDEDFDDLPLDELDSVILSSTNITAQSDGIHRSTPQNNNILTGNPNRATNAQTAQSELHTSNDSGSQLGSNNSRSNTQKRDFAKRAAALESDVVADDESDFLDEEMDCFLAEVDTGRLNQLPVHQGPSKYRESSTNKTDTAGSSCRITSESSKSVTQSAFDSSHNTAQVQNNTSTTAVFDRLSAKAEPQCSSPPALTLTSPPFTYLCVFEEMMSKPQHHTTEIRVKAFIVTLLGKLSSNNGFWRVCATISDGTGYMDVELSNEVLTGLLGFSVAEKGALKRDPARRGELDIGMRRCQEELVDMCSVMTIVVGPDGRKAVVTRADPVNEKVVQQLEQRVRDGKK